jgi:ammonium transporter, Amt family
MLGTFILWFGWYGFNTGSALLLDSDETAALVALTAVNTTLSGGTAGVIALLVNTWHTERTTGEVEFDLKMAMNGALAGLVAITGGCAVFEPWAAMVTGVCAGIVYFLGSKYLVYLRIDDAVDAIPVHLCAGVLGAISVGLYASPTRLQQVFGRSDHPGLIYCWAYNKSNGTLLATQAVGLLFILTWITAIMLPFFVWLDWKGWFRSDPLDELLGLDRSYHGGLALLADTDGVNPEYITALQKKRSESNNLRQRRPVNVNPSTMTAGSSVEGPPQPDDPQLNDPWTNVETNSFHGQLSV